MILRRLIEHIEAQNWFAVGIDFVIVVAGVFMGIQVSNWNNDRVERLQEQEMLVRLHEDFTASTKGQARDVRFLEQQFSDQAVILESLRACEVTPENAVAFQRGVVTLGYINPPRFFRRTIDEMAAAGKTGIIRSDTIKDRLADIVEMVEWRGNGIDNTARITEHYRFIVEEQVHYDFTATYADPFLGEFFGVVFDVEILCKNPSNVSAVSAISQMTRERENAYRPILDKYQAFLPLLEQELRERWQLTIRGEAAP
jgi:hypothetical protein